MQIPLRSETLRTKGWNASIDALVSTVTLPAVTPQQCPGHVPYHPTFSFLWNVLMSKKPLRTLAFPLWERHGKNDSKSLTDLEADDRS